MKSKLKNVKITPMSVYFGIVSFVKELEIMRFQKYVPSMYEDLNFRYPGLTVFQLSGFGVLYRNFEDGDISYKEFMRSLKSLEIEEIDSVVFRENCLKEEMERELFRKRKETGNYLPMDIFGFYYKSSSKQGFLLGKDELIMRLLAELGDERAMREIEETSYPEKYKFKGK